MEVHTVGFVDPDSVPQKYNIPLADSVASLPEFRAISSQHEQPNHQPRS